MVDYLAVLLNAIYAFIGLFIISKILGKKQISELSFTDYVVGISIGSIAAEWSTDVVNPWYYYVIAMASFLLLSLAITHFERTTLFLKSFLRGKPIIIVQEGKINYKNLKKSKLDVNDLLGMCRSKGFFDLSDVSFAIFETSGELSLLPIGAKKPTVLEDLGKKGEYASLSKFLVNDGIIDKNYLNQLNKDKLWLFKRLTITSKKELKNILVAFYDEEKDKFTIHYKK